MNNEELEKLGWEFKTYWKNRGIYELGIGNIFEHNGSVGIIYKKELIYCNLSDEELKEYTDIIIQLNDLEGHPDKHTYLEALNMYKKEMKFVERMLEKANGDENKDDE